MPKNDYTHLTYSKEISNSRGGICRTAKANPSSRFFLPDELKAVEVENMYYDEHFNQLIITGEPGQLAVAYCELTRQVGFGFEPPPDFDMIYIFEIEEGDLYPELPIEPGKILKLNIKPGQRFILPEGSPVEILVANDVVAKINDGAKRIYNNAGIFLDQQDGRPALAVGVYPDGRTQRFEQPAKATCMLNIGDQLCGFVFEVASLPTANIYQNSTSPETKTRSDLHKAGPDFFQIIQSDEDTVFLVPDRLEVRHCTNATYNAIDKTVTAHLVPGEKTRIFLKASADDSSVGITEFQLLKKPEHPYLPEIIPGQELTIKCKRGDHFTLPGDEQRTPESRYAFRQKNVVNARVEYVAGRAILQVGVDDDGNPIKAKRGKGKAMLVVDLNQYDGYADVIQEPRLATYVFQY